MIKTLKQCKQETNNYLAYYDGQPTEFDMSINDISRDTVEAMHHENGECWLGKINLYSGDEKPFKLIKWTPGTTVLNFEYSFILPKHSTEIEKMVNDRDTNPSTGKELYQNGQDIINKIYELGGTVLVWS